jgi:NAD+ diphosphatase
VLDGKQKVSVGFVGGRLDRADRLRADAALLAEAFAHPQARLVLLAALDPVVKGSSLVTEPLPKYRDEERLGLLGFDDEGPLFVQLEEEGLPHGAQQSPIGRRAMAMLTPEALACPSRLLRAVRWGDAAGARGLVEALRLLPGGAFPPRRSGGHHAGRA